MENLEINGVPTNSTGNTFEWMPKKNTKFGYDALFLHYFGIAQFAVELTDAHDVMTVVVFEHL